jgi:hypothetical protein
MNHAGLKNIQKAARAKNWARLPILRRRISGWMKAHTELRQPFQTA